MPNIAGEGNEHQGTKGIAEFKAHEFGGASVSPLLSKVEAGHANDSGMSPMVITSFNFDRSAGREFKL